MEFFFLNDPVVLEVSGKDAERYLNARLTLNIKQLGTGDNNAAACLNPQGKTEALFNIRRQSAEEFTLLCDDGNREQIITALKRYLVADRVTVNDVSERYKVLVLFQESMPAELAAYSSMVSRPARSLEKSYDLLIPENFYEPVRQMLKMLKGRELSAIEADVKRMQAGVPSFPSEISEKTIFSATSLKDIISPAKGCYVGQEVIEKTEAMGKVPYQLRAYYAYTEVTPDSKIISEQPEGPGLAGKVISVVFDKDSRRYYFFAEIRNNPKILDSKLTINDTVINQVC